MSVTGRQTAGRTDGQTDILIANAATTLRGQLASCLIYARALLEYVNFIVWVRSVNKMSPSVKFAKYKVLTFLILREKC